MTTSKPSPIAHVRIGSVNAAIWANQAENGIRYGVTLERLYRDPESGKWKSSSTLNRDDLLVAGKVLDLAHSRIHELQAQSRASGRDEPGEADSVETQPKPPAPRAGGASAPPSHYAVTPRVARAKARADASR